MNAMVSTPRSPYPFTDSGLDYVYLIGIEHFKCANGHQVARIPAIEQLLDVIARSVVQRSEALSGDEIRFLRKRLFKKAVEFSRDIGIEPETLSRIENDKQQAKESTDKLIRLYYAVCSGDPELLKRMKEDMVELLANWTEIRSRKKLVATVKGTAWDTKAIA